ncbi:LuxR C-terminal-related transcriptional regulator [Streptomyces sp. NPDC056149]|uniref:LuxR C-terminal-related transcriptional regulator n=1 Tax=Streptomyces sp. NPDC056149 TaxID=3345728 RepID=UPI0035DC0971
MPRNITPIDSLSPAEVRATRLVAQGLTGGEIAVKLRLAKGTVDGQLRHAQQKMVVSDRACLVHRCYVREQLPRPQRIEPSQQADAADVELLRFVAFGADYAEMAQRNSHGVSQHGAKTRLKALREKWGARNDAHLITCGWEFGLLDESTTAPGLADDRLARIR